MRPTTLVLLPLLLSLGCATQEGSKGSGISSQTDLPSKSCSSQHYPVKSSGESSQPCRSQRAWLERLGTALDGAAAAVRAPNQ